MNSIVKDSPKNWERASWALAGLNAFRVATGRTGEEEMQEAISDLICDLLHLAYIKGFPATAIHSAAYEHFEHELKFPDDAEE